METVSCSSIIGSTGLVVLVSKERALPPLDKQGFRWTES